MLEHNYTGLFFDKPMFNITDSAFSRGATILVIDIDNICIEMSGPGKSKVIVQLERKIGSGWYPYSNSFSLNNSKRRMRLDSIGLEKLYSYRVIVRQGNRNIK
jgi:hypothetical protein